MRSGLGGKPHILCHCIDSIEEVKDMPMRPTDRAQSVVLDKESIRARASAGRHVSLARRSHDEYVGGGATDRSRVKRSKRTSLGSSRKGL